MTQEEFDEYVYRYCYKSDGMLDYGLVVVLASYFGFTKGSFRYLTYDPKKDLKSKLEADRLNHEMLKGILQ